MSEQNDSTASELNLDTSANAEQASDSEATEGNQEPESKQPEKADLTFLDGESKSESAEPSKEEARKKSLIGQVNAAQKKIDAGKKSIEEFPEYVQEELRERGVEQTVQKTAPKEVNQEQLVKQVLDQLKNKETFDTLRGELSQMDLSTEQANALKAEYKELKQSGLTDHKSLETAVRLAGLSNKVEQARQQGIQIGRMALGSQGQPQSLRKPGEVDPLDLEGEDFIKWAEKQGRDDMYHTKRRSTL